VVVPALCKDGRSETIETERRVRRHRPENNPGYKATATTADRFQQKRGAATVADRALVFDEVRAVGPDAVLRPAVPDDCRRIAELFRIASDGVADYVWSELQAQYPGASLVEIGRRRYARENTAFSYQNCLVAEHEGAVIGMMHAFVIEPADEPAPARAIDPVLRPYAELEAPGSLYISALAVTERHRGRGIGRRFLAAARERARRLGCPSLSLICFEGNDGAKRLYEREGFATIDRREIVPHPLIHVTGTALLMTSTVWPGRIGGTGCGMI
jgi:GNAT superfamily N-acetyltransferase